MKIQLLSEVIAAAINRLVSKARPREDLSAEYKNGRSAGHAWATSWKNPVELERIAQLAACGDIRAPVDGDVGAVLGVHMAEALGLNPHGPHIVIRAKAVLFPDDPDATQSAEYIRGYVRGAAEVWQTRATHATGDGEEGDRE